MKIKQLRQKKADLVKEGKLLFETAEAAGRRLTKEEMERDDAINAELILLAGDIERVERQMDREREVADGISAESVSVGVDNTILDPRAFKGHRDFFMSVMDAGSGRKMDKRLIPYRSPFKATQGSDEQGVYSDPYGGFLVPHTILPGVMSIGVEDDPMAKYTTKIPMRTPMVGINARVDKNHTTSVSGGLIVTRRPETVDGTSSRMKFEQIQLNAHELFGLAFATESILSDSPESFIAILEAGFKDEFAAKAIEERLTGTGVGEPLGVMNSGCLLTVLKQAAQPAATIVTENIEKMSARCWKFGKAIWIANHNCKPQLMALVRLIGTAGGTNIPYYQPATGENGVDTLLGRPIYFSEFAKTLGTKGDIILGNWSEYLDGEYQPLQQAESMHVRFLANERAFKFWLRNDGQPWWNTVMTPRNGDTLSPFVVMETRA